MPVLIAIAVSSNLQGAATMVGDTTSMLLGSYAGMNFLDFFWMQGRPGIFWGVELGALASLVALLVIFRKYTEKVSAAVETEVTDYVPSALMIGTVALLIVASFLPEPSDPALKAVYEPAQRPRLRGLCLIGVVRDCLRKRSGDTFLRVLKDLDKDTLLLLFGLFMVIEGIRVAGVIDAAADLFYNISGDNPFLLYTLIVFASVVLSAFIDNIPYVATMLPVVEGIAALMNGGAGLPPYVFYFGLLTGATLGGNLTPSAPPPTSPPSASCARTARRCACATFLRIAYPSRSLPCLPDTSTSGSSGASDLPTKRAGPKRAGALLFSRMRGIRGAS